MNDNFATIEDETVKAPDALKEMVVSELDFIRDTMQLFNMFFGESFVAIGMLLQTADDSSSDAHTS